VENDSRAALLGEETYGVLAKRQPRENNVVMLTLGKGIGVAARVNGQLVRGAHHCGGILGGHITVDLNGPRCQCGNRGCAETLASEWALEQRMINTTWFANSTLANADSPTFKGLCHAVRQGDKYAQQGLNYFIDVWTSLLVSLVNLLDPKCLVLSGGFIYSADLFLQPLQESVRKRLWLPDAMPEFMVAEQPEMSGIRGAEVLVRQAVNG
jgi:glucokinase